MKTIGVIGTRRRNHRNDFAAIEDAVKAIYEPGDRFVSGGAPAGGDRFAELIARDLGATIIIHYAGWKTNGRKAGFMRNGDIAHDADVLIACVAPDRTGGTEDTIKKFVAAKGKDPILV
jgi:hypothetical protein